LLKRRRRAEGTRSETARGEKKREEREKTPLLVEEKTKNGVRRLISAALARNAAKLVKRRRL